jgi:hypothetical protein
MSTVFYNAIIDPVKDPKELAANVPYSVLVDDEKIVTMYINTQEIDSFYVSDYTYYHVINYFKDDTKYSMTLNIIAGDNYNREDVSVDVIYNDVNYNYYEHEGIIRISFSQQGDYYLMLITNDEALPVFSMTETEVSVVKQSLWVTSLIGMTSIIGSGVLFYYTLKSPDMVI